MDFKTVNNILNDKENSMLFLNLERLHLRHIQRNLSRPDEREWAANYQPC
jgi:hypothetical protein